MMRHRMLSFHCGFYYLACEMTCVSFFSFLRIISAFLCFIRESDRPVGMGERGGEDMQHKLGAGIEPGVAAISTEP